MSLDLVFFLGMLIKKERICDGLEKMFKTNEKSVQFLFEQCSLPFTEPNKQRPTTNNTKLVFILSSPNQTPSSVQTQYL